VTLEALMALLPAHDRIEIRIIARPDEDCWDLRTSVDGVVLHSRRVLTRGKLTTYDAKALHSAVEQEIDSWLF
jgi:hypothetical protein